MLLDENSLDIIIEQKNNKLYFYGIIVQFKIFSDNFYHWENIQIS